MVDFEKVNYMLELIENSEIPEGKTFNEFCLEFFNEVKLIPLSKYLRSKNMTNRLPKIMNTRKAGELIYDTLKNSEMLAYIKRNSKTSEIPELDYKIIMLLRKVDVKTNWDKIFRFISGETVQKINNSTKPELLPVEKNYMKSVIIERLKINEVELDWLIDKISIINNDIELSKNLKKLLK